MFSSEYLLTLNLYYGQAKKRRPECCFEGEMVCRFALLPSSESSESPAFFLNWKGRFVDVPLLGKTAEHGTLYFGRSCCDVDLSTSLHSARVFLDNVHKQKLGISCEQLVQTRRRLVAWVRMDIDPRRWPHRRKIFHPRTRLSSQGS